MFAALTLFASAGCKPSNAVPAESITPDTHVTELADSERRAKVAADLKLVREYDEGLRATLAYAQTQSHLFVKDEREQLTPAQKEELREIWRTVLDYMRALDHVKGDWRDFHKYGMLRERRAHIEAFLVGYAAWITQYRHGLDFIALTVPSRPMEKLLDEPSAAHDIPAAAFTSLKFHLINVRSVTRLGSSHQYWKTVRGSLADYDCSARPGCGWALTVIDRYHDEAKAKLKERGVRDFAFQAFDTARDVTFEAWFPVQANVAEWMGDTKVARLDQHLVSREQLDAMREAMEPGDVLVARQNWYLSNVGLPGFWPHAELYLGSPQELAAYFDTAEVKQYFSDTHGVADLPTFLQQKYPQAYAHYTQAADDGEPRRVIEAISEGVVIRSLEQAASADYVGVMRPRQSKVDKARAIARSFHFFGLAYDFNFDFATDNTLVCTELVYKSYRATERGDLGVDLSRVMGRMTLPANELVRQFDATADADDAPLAFVYFLDGRELERDAVVRDAAAFRASWRRPKWDIVQR